MELFKLVETEWWSLNKEHYTDFWKNTNTMWMEDKYWPDDVKNEWIFVARITIIEQLLMRLLYVVHLIICGLG